MHTLAYYNKYYTTVIVHACIAYSANEYVLQQAVVRNLYHTANTHLAGGQIEVQALAVSRIFKDFR